MKRKRIARKNKVTGGRTKSSRRLQEREQEPIWISVGHLPAAIPDCYEDEEEEEMSSVLTMSMK